MKLLISMTIVLLYSSIESLCTAIKDQSTGHADKKRVYKRNVGIPIENLFRNQLAAQQLANQHTPARFHNVRWSEFTPNTPSPEEVECEIEIPYTEVVGGRCVRLGGLTRTAVCQSGSNLGFLGDQCEQILADREAAEQANIVQQALEQQQAVIKKRSVAETNNALKDKEDKYSLDI